MCLLLVVTLFNVMIYSKKTIHFLRFVLKPDDGHTFYALMNDLREAIKILEDLKW